MRLVPGTHSDTGDTQHNAHDTLQINTTYIFSHGAVLAAHNTEGMQLPHPRRFDHFESVLLSHCWDYYWHGLKIAVHDFIPLINRSCDCSKRSGQLC